jgi:hypothetical protein
VEVRSGPAIAALVLFHPKAWVFAKRVNPSHFSRLLRMKLLYPEIVEGTLVGRQPERPTMARATQPFASEFILQHTHLDPVGPTNAS